MEKAPKTLVGIVNFTYAKSYCDAQFRRMMKECVVPIVGADNIIVASERQDPDWPTIILPVPNNGIYAEDMLIEGRERFRIMAMEGGYDKMLWQGVDAFWQSRADFEHVLHHDVPAVAPLISARTDSSYAIARRFKSAGSSLSEEQEDIPSEQLERGGLVYSGFPGADNIVIDRRLFLFPFKEGHAPWYERVAQGLANVCVEENWVLKVERAGYPVYVDTDIKVWHCHNDGVARMWPGIEQPTDSLTW